jgi:DNA-binding beta-propeller fold protein YncE
MFLRSKLSVLVVALGGLALLGPLPLAAAEDGEPDVTVVASHLNNPRGLNFGPDGALYIAEAGKGGSGPCAETAEGTTCVGLTGAVTRVEDGEQERVVRRLPSHATEDGSFAFGPHDVSLRKHLDMYVTVGLGGAPELREAFGPKGRLLGYLVRSTAGGEVERVADIAAFEAAENPDGDVIDTNPFGVLKRGGRRIVADAGGNSLLKVDSEGNVTTLAVFPARSVTFQGQQIDMHAVPTSVALGPDDDYFVGQLTGFPFPRGGARVYRVPAGGGKPEIYARGFTNIIDVAFDDEGRLIVLEIAHNSLLAKKPFGALLRVEDDGSVTTLYDKLFFPGGVAVAEDGSFYVTNCGICAGTGEVLRIDP